MKKILLIGSAEESEAQAIRAALAEEYELETRPDAAAGTELLKTPEEHQIVGVLLDRPAALSGARELIDCVDRGNQYLLSIPVLLLTDRAHLDEDARFLGGAAVDCVEKPVAPVVLRNRLALSISRMNSVSFSEFAWMLKALPACIYLKDAQGRYVFSSQIWHHLDTSDDPNWTLRGKTDLDIRKDKENAQRALESDLSVIRTGKGVSYVIEENDDDTQEFLQIIKEPLIYEDGRVRGLIALINNVTEQELLRRELKRQSVTDTLTGLYNRTYYSEYVETLRKASLYPLSILSMDCDNLKKVNDMCGQQTGDQYIRMSVMLLRECLPRDSAMFRIGGDQFVAFLPKTTAEQLDGYVKAIRSKAAGLVVRGNTLNVSLGASTMGSPEENLADHIRHTDEMVRAEKQAKKDANRY